MNIEASAQASQQSSRIQSQQPTPLEGRTPSSSVPPSRGGPSDPTSVPLSSSAISSTLLARGNGTSLLTASMQNDEGTKKTGKMMVTSGFAGHIVGSKQGLVGSSGPDRPFHHGQYAGRSNVSHLVASNGGFTNGDVSKPYNLGVHDGKKSLSHFDHYEITKPTRTVAHDYYSSLLSAKNANSANLSEPPNRF